MAFLTSLLTLTRTTRIADMTEDNTIQLVFETDPYDPLSRVGDKMQSVIVLPDDDDDALLMIELIEASLDNMASAVRLRQQRRERASVEGAGASVEAYRG